MGKTARLGLKETDYEKEFEEQLCRNGEDSPVGIESADLYWPALLY